MNKNKYLKAYYDDDGLLIKGLKSLKKEGVEILDVLTPFPVHDIDKILGYRRSWIARVGFIGGAVGAVIGFGFQVWVFTVDYPLNIGGKPFLAVPSFIPVTFEMTVLCAAFAMVFAFLIRSKIGPGAEPFIHDERSTDDRFLILVGVGKNATEETVSELKNKISNTGAQGIVLKDDVELSKNY
ncbi:MAG: DUF3341 domain-containing protein [Bacteroidales bacterium]|nr:DUF3341 domain-containing protein [Bacteroidales bacterium]